MSILTIKEKTSDCSSIWSHLDLLLLLSAQTDSNDQLTDIEVEQQKCYLL